MDGHASVLLVKPSTQATWHRNSEMQARKTRGVNERGLAASGLQFCSPALRFEIRCPAPKSDKLNNMPSLTLKPTHKAVAAYYESLSMETLAVVRDLPPVQK
jgi:hypothetical protein